MSAGARGMRPVETARTLHLFWRGRRIPRIPALHAFTVLEVLVVAAILAALAALGIPAALRALERAEEAKNIGNLRQIGVAFLAFAAENGGKLPHCFDSGTGQTYAHFIQDYLPQNLGEPTRNVFVSPRAKKRINPGPNTIAITYSAHPMLLHEALPGEDRRVPLVQVVRPSQVILLADAPQIPWNNNQATANFWNPWQVFFPELVADAAAPIPTGPDTDSDDAQGWFRYRNKGAVHALMADGNVAAFPKGNVTFANLLWDR